MQLRRYHLGRSPRSAGVSGGAPSERFLSTRRGARRRRDVDRGVEGSAEHSPITAERVGGTRGGVRMRSMDHGGDVGAPLRSTHPGCLNPAMPACDVVNCRQRLTRASCCVSKTRFVRPVLYAEISTLIARRRWVWYDLSWCILISFQFVDLKDLI